MKRSLIFVLSLMLFLLGISSGAFSYTRVDVGTPAPVWDYSGEWMGTYAGNDDASEIEAIMLSEHDLGLDIAFYGKNEGDGTEGGVINLTYYDNDDILLIGPDAYKSGTHGAWEVASGDVLNFYTVKGGPNFSLFRLVPALAEGDWTNEFLPDAGQSGNPPTISHFAGYTVVPIPATIFLFGTGLIGLAGFGRIKYIFDVF